MSNLCIYHKACADGFGAALAVKKHFDNKSQHCDFLPAHYRDSIPDVTGKNVIIVDFSYRRDILIKMKEQANSLLVLDHHKSAEENLKGLDFCIFDMNRSGAMMAWEYFHPDKPVPDLIKYIQDRDLWKWELPKSKEFSAGLQLLEMSFERWEHLLNNEASNLLFDSGSVILAYQEQQILRAIESSKIKMVNVNGYKVPMLNTTTLISEICGKLAEKHPFAITYFDTPTDRIYSLRSREDGIDVSQVAKLYGGGGHAQAAGFSISLKKAQIG